MWKKNHIVVQNKSSQFPPDQKLPEVIDFPKLLNFTKTSTWFNHMLILIKHFT